MSPPLTCIRRNGAAWATAQRLVPSYGAMERFSVERQKFCVALSLNQPASTLTPLTVTSSGFFPRPCTEV